MMLYILLSLIVCCDGFLLEGKTQPPPTKSPSMSDEHFYTLLKLLTEEMQYRRQLEQDMTKLKQDLLTTEREVTTKYIMWTKCNSTVEKRILNLSNSTSNLQTQFVLLQTKYDSLKQEYTVLKQNHTILEAHSAEIEQKLSRLEQMKNFSNIQTVLNVVNETKHLETEIQKTNTRLDRVVSEADARKQDFVALFNKGLSTDERLENISLSQQMKWNELSSKVSMNQASVNNMTVSFNNKLNGLSVRVAMTACNDNGGSMRSDSVIPFQKILQSYGIKDQSSFTSTGIFTCEQEGLYLVTVNLVEESKGYLFDVTLNGSVIRNCYASYDATWQESSCTTVIQLNVHDKISVKPTTAMFITNLYSCITIVKIM